MKHCIFAISCVEYAYTLVEALSRIVIVVKRLNIQELHTLLVGA